VIGKHSTALTATDVGPPVDVIVHEIFGDDLLEEGVLNAVPDAVSRLSKPGVMTIPRQASVRVALAEFTKVPQDSGIVGRYDLSLFSRHIKPTVRLRVGSRHLQLRSEPLDLVEFNFSDPPAYEGRPSVTAYSTGGIVNGIVQWLRIRFDEDNCYENRPATGSTSAWLAVFHPFKAIPTSQGDCFTIDGYYNGSVLCIWGSHPKAG
jgi:hypothetical protein